MATRSSTSSVLRLRLRQLRQSGALHDRADFDEVLPQYLFLTFCIARASVPLMRAALTRLHDLGKPKRLVQRYGAYLERHIEEERDHDTWLVDDLKAVGWSRAQCLKRPVPASVASGVGAQYYWIQHSHPVSLLGYMAVLEGTLPSQAELEPVIEASRYPAKAYRALLHHARIDAAHSEAVLDLIDRLPLDARCIRILDQSFMHTAQWLTQLSRELLPS